MSEQETTFVDTFTSTVGALQSAFTVDGCELRYSSGARVFPSRDTAHIAIAQQQTGFAAWDQLDHSEAQRQAFDASRWQRRAFTHSRWSPGDKPHIDTSAYPSIPPTSPPHPMPTET